MWELGPEFAQKCEINRKFLMILFGLFISKIHSCKYVPLQVKKLYIFTDSELLILHLQIKYSMTSYLAAHYLVRAKKARTEKEHL